MDEDGLGNVVIHARLKGTLPVSIHGIGCHGDDLDGNLPWSGQALHESQFIGGLIAIQARHLAIHEDHGKGMSLNPFQRLVARFSHRGTKPQFSACARQPTD